MAQKLPEFQTLIEVFRYAAGQMEPEESNLADQISLESALKSDLEEHESQTAFFNKDQHKNFQEHPFEEVFSLGQNVGLYLLQAGLTSADRVGLFSDNRLEWMIADIAVLLNGAADVPRGADSTGPELEYILDHAGCEFAFFETIKLLNKIDSFLDRGALKHIIILNPATTDTELDAFCKKRPDIQITTLQDAMTQGAALRETRLRELEQRSDSVKPEDLFTIIYTSGTTGAPKGVMLTHANIAYNINEVPAMIGTAENERCLSILPIWHIFERCLEYAMLPLGVRLYYTNIRDLRDDFQKVKPTFMASAPRLWENIYTGIMAKMEKEDPEKKFLFDAAVKVKGNRLKAVNHLSGKELKTGEPETPGRLTLSALSAVNLFLPSLALDHLVFSKLRDGLGGHLKGTISGGGALPPHVDEFFNIIGIPVYEGYGMTECAPIIAVRPRGRLIQGTVGFAPPGTQIKILDEQGKDLPRGQKGVIHVKGPQVMKGYYKNEEATTKVLSNGWMNTGDLGLLDLNNALAITGRAKDTIVLLGGENIEPEPIEGKLKEDDFISQVMVVGQDRKNLGALIWPDTSKLKSAGFKITEGEDLNKNEALRAHFQPRVKKLISGESGFKSFERINGFQFLPKALEVGDELTNLHKMKRNVISDKYQELIERT